MTPTGTRRKSETLGRRLAAARVILGLSQEDAAEKSGVSQPYLSKLENDQAPAPPLHTITRLAELYGVTIDYLVNGTGA